MTKITRLSFLRSRAVALRLVSLGSIGAPSALSSPADTLPAPVKSVHVWRKTAREDQGEALPAGYVSAPVTPFVPAIDKVIDAEVAPIAYAEALPEIGAHNLRHAVNCMLIALPWRG